MRLLQYSICLLVAMLIAGCSSQQLSAYRAGDELSTGNGWLALSVSSSTSEIAFEIRGVGLSSRRYQSPVFTDGQGFRLMQLPVGEYELSGVFDKALLLSFIHPEAAADFTFSIYPRSATLLGELILDGDSLAMQRFSADHSQADDFLAESFIPLEGLYLITNDNDEPGRFWKIRWTRAD